MDCTRSAITVLRLALRFWRFPCKASYADSRTLARVSLRTPRNPLAPRIRAAVSSKPPYPLRRSRGTRDPTGWRSRPPLLHDRYIVSASYCPSPFVYSLTIALNAKILKLSVRMIPYSGAVVRRKMTSAGNSRITRLFRRAQGKLSLYSILRAGHRNLTRKMLKHYNSNYS